ncbi:MAG: DNA polymerase III subunit gamma/tau [Candidatus Omnitrophica bacterium CG11_big_fil_rev_8_21_14_0_20_45_26]|uniref:DNA polymerase III subunit gamma/tau n=1 Tax=Candidatus Abzuiibacterium crystallinum TaxID=1974748 RepID=A0A2H0LPY9_9BACT|nr:MAG: DNA polymerase III subunit gamma/tau [Candidatus Omnitrophica bacterium CG11_big_fil_rev_8_21_14_0_20_45_26]PIW63620.1 MAG: DNA polymerase III subunit gamma/tau [Candidatus Omnitrophica bacterium CG12_big_fil_rev_8_21_14_0_65_45_16]
MSYLVFARKFRPQTFDDVVGQEHVTTTLKNAIQKKRIAQSFLFSGSRGIGKTSTARILAKALNCEKPTQADPCNRCDTCLEISNGTSLDVLEIDGASNRGIDEIRTLRENVKFKPARGQYKVYIIDEVHMLTGEAFNALLKTLEEPPSHVKFIFATTEPHKVPLTILSRCQRFHFKRVSSADIHAKLKAIAKQEKIKAKDNVLYLIAKSAEGSLRDAESLLDQLTSFSEGEIKEEDVIFSLGLTSTEVYFKFFEALKGRNSAQVLKLIHELVGEGKDIEQFLKGLLEGFRDLLVLSLGEPKEGWIEQDEDTIKTLGKWAKQFGRDELFLIVSLLQQTIREIRWSRTPRFLAEICLLKIANRADLKSINDLLTELKNPAASPVVSSTRQSIGAGQTSVPEQKKKDQINLTVSKSAGYSDAATRAQTQVGLSPRLTRPAHSQNSNLSLSDIETVWPELLARVKEKRMSIGMFLSESAPIEAGGTRVVFGFPAEFKFHKETIEQQNNKLFVRDILSELLGCQAEVVFVLTEAEQVEKPAAGQPVKDPNVDIVMSAMEIFEGSKVIRKT